MKTTYSGINKCVVTNDYFDKSGNTYRKQPICADVFSQDFVSPQLTATPKKDKTIICFHGSAGCKEDFGELRNHLSPISLHAYPRKNYPGFSNSYLDCLSQRESQVLVGYSWGCRELLEYYTKNHTNIESVILISPYILNSSKSSFSIKSRLIIGFMKRMLVAIESKIFNSSRDIHNNDNPGKHTLLKRTLLYLCGLYEKTEHQVISYASILRLIAEVDTTVHVITGTSDTSTHSQQSQELIRAINCNLMCHFVKGGNHDILKTHMHQIARIIQQITHGALGYDQRINTYQPRELLQCNA